MSSDEQDGKAFEGDAVVTANEAEPEPQAPRSAIARLREEFEATTGAPVERVSGLTRAEDGWQGRIEVVELQRVPPSMDVLASYVVKLDDEGQLVSFERGRRYRRTEVGDL